METSASKPGPRRCPTRPPERDRHAHGDDAGRRTPAGRSI